MAGTYLISGASGSGKSTIGVALAARGYTVIDADEQFGYFGNLQVGSPAAYPRKLTKQWLADNGWLWNYLKLSDVLAKPFDGTRFVVGGARNERKFYQYFDRIFVLHCDDEELVRRLKSRDGGHTNNDIVIKRMRLQNLDAAQHAGNIDATLIDTTKPTDDSVKDILHTIGDAV